MAEAFVEGVGFHAHDVRPDGHDREALHGGPALDLGNEEAADPAVAMRCAGDGRRRARREAISSSVAG
jgi:hypothetical protein